MGLSQDPEKRERQMSNLRKGWEKHAQRLQEPASPAPEPKPRAVTPALEVMPYDPAPEAEPEPKPKARRKPAQRPARKPAGKRPARELRGDPEPAPEPRGSGGGGGFWDGFFGR